MYPVKARIILAITLALAVLGQINHSFLGLDIEGVSSEKISIAMYVPLALALFWVLKKWGIPAR